MEILGLQLDIVWENKEANFEKVRGLLEKANATPGSLVVLPEMFDTGFSMNVSGICGGTDDFLAEMAKRFGIYLLGGTAGPAENGKGKNEAVVFGPQGKELARYGKLHPFSYAGETNYFVPGNSLVLFEWAGVKVAPFICYDLRFPEVFRQAVRQGAELFVVIANWPAARELHWKTLLRARAIENQAFVAGVNRCGKDPKHDYSGQSLIIDPRGQILAEGGTQEGILRAEINPELVRAYRQEFPALQDIRPEFLGPPR
jgi:omega-amidase